jgi:hypothetical protein
MTVALMLRALRKCAVLENIFHRYGITLIDRTLMHRGDKYERISDKLEQRILEKFVDLEIKIGDAILQELRSQLHK